MNLYPDNDQRTEIEATIKAIRMIGLAMTTGVITIGIISALFIERRPNPNPSEILFQVMAAISVTLLLGLSFYWPRISSSKLSSQSAFNTILQTFRSSCIVSMALSEAASVMLLVTGFVNGRLIPEALFAIIPLIVLLMNIPGVDKIQRFYQEIAVNGR